MQVEFDCSSCGQRYPWLLTLRALHFRPCSPFGIYLLHTVSGNLVCENADDAAQMLFLTLQRNDNAVDTRPSYIISEHMMPRYEAAMAAYLADTETAPRKWGALTYDTRNMFELGVVMALSEQSEAQEKILRYGHQNAMCRVFLVYMHVYF